MAVHTYPRHLSLGSADVPFYFVVLCPPVLVLLCLVLHLFSRDLVLLQQVVDYFALLIRREAVLRTPSPWLRLLPWPYCTMLLLDLREVAWMRG